MLAEPKQQTNSDIIKSALGSREIPEKVAWEKNLSRDSNPEPPPVLFIEHPAADRTCDLPT